MINDLNISACMSLLISSETLIIITFAKYKEDPLTANAITIKTGIITIIPFVCSIKSSFIAGSNK